ncbi:MAG: DUF3426 domain-containing protein [Phenylobacterium sp.]|uniref:DUF3426 domain-containing protein n=1 Tax=Phenylobacterium sp. TaxID=1871053 RepID=UPI00391BEBF6
MILTCPECATSYFVDESKIPPEGRLVKCAACGARWTAHPEPEPQAEPEPAFELEEPAEAAAPEIEPAEAAVEDEPALTGEDLPKVFRAKADESRRVREAAATGVVWAGMAASVAVLIALAIVFRVDVVRLWPRTAGAYASVGLPVNSLGLTIEGVRAEPSLQEGHAALSVSGMIRNIEGRAIVTPPLRISLLGKDGKPLATKIARAADPRIPPGETRHFALVMLDPPATASELEIAFAPDAPAHGAATAPKAKAAHAAPELRGPAEPAAPAHAPAPEPVEAQPLEMETPYTLDGHE